MLAEYIPLVFSILLVRKKQRLLNPISFVKAKTSLAYGVSCVGQTAAVVASALFFWNNMVLTASSLYDRFKYSLRKSVPISSTLMATICLQGHEA
jgi:hypothetical protein